MTETQALERAQSLARSCDHGFVKIDVADLRALLARSNEGAEPREVAWLIEWPADRQMPVRYWHPTEGRVLDPNHAVRFSRRDDAQAAIKGPRLYGSPRPVEHVFDLYPSPQPQGGGDRTELAVLIARYFRAEIGRLMQQAEHWAANGKPLAVHHRVTKADAYFQIVALFERHNTNGWGDSFDHMAKNIDTGAIKLHGVYPPSAELHRYRDPSFVAAMLSAAPKAPVEGEREALAGQCRMQARDSLDPDYIRFMERVAAALSTPSPRVSVEEIACSLETAPTDGTMVRLLVDYSDEANAAEIKRLDGKGYIWPWTPLDDAEQAWTIGFNSFENTGGPGWKFVGWDWAQDVFCEGRGKPIGWLPWENPEASPAKEGEGR